MEKAALEALDRWIAEEAGRMPPRRLSREEATQALAVEALIGMGLLAPDVLRGGDGERR